MQAINTATYWHRRMNKIPVYLCIAILLGQVMLFSSEDSMNISSEDSEFDIENTVLTSGRNDAEDAGWVIETVETSSSQGSWVEHGKYNSLAIDSNGTPHISYISAIGTNYVINHTSFDGQTWNSNTVATSSGGPCSALDSSDNPHVGLYTTDSSGNGDLRLATNTGQSPSSWTLEMIDNSSTNVGSNCDMKVGPNGDIYVVYWKWEVNNHSLKFAHYDGNSWTTSDIDNDGGSDSSLQIDKLGNLHVSYRDLTNGGLKYGINNGQGWVLSTIEGNGQGKGNSLVLDSNNDPHVSYFDGYNNRLKYASLTGTSWSFSTVETGLSWGNSSNAVHTDTSIGIDSSDNVHISYYNAGLKYAFYDGTSWNFTLIDTVENIEGNTNLIVDDEQRIHISYHDKENKSLKYAFFEEETTVPGGGNESITSQMNYNTGTEQLWANFSAAGLTNGSQYNVYFILTNSANQAISSGNQTIYPAGVNWMGDFGHWPLNLSWMQEGSTYCMRYEISHLGQSNYISSDESCVTIPSGSSNSEEITPYLNFDTTSLNLTADIDGSSLTIGDSYEVQYFLHRSLTGQDQLIDSGLETFSNVTARTFEIWDEWVLSSPENENGINRGDTYCLQVKLYNDGTHVTTENSCVTIPATGSGEGGSGVTWSNITIDSEDNVGMDSSLAIDSWGWLHISYSDATNADLKYATDKSGSWVTSTIDSDGNVGSKSSLAIDSNDKVHISYRDNTNTGLKYATDKSGSWVTSTIDSVGNVGYDTSLAIDSNGDVHISYRNGANGDLKYATDKSGSWVTSTIADDSDGNMGVATSLAIDSNDDVHISYWDSANGDLKYAADKSGSWVTSTIDSDGNVGAPSSLAIDSNNDIHISYRDATNGGLKYITTATSSGGEGGSVTDNDDDGVHDSEDDCPGTLPGQQVDLNGCVIDNSTSHWYSYDDGEVDVALSVADYYGIGVLFSAANGGERIISIEWYQEDTILANTTVQIAVAEVDENGNILPVEPGHGTTITPHLGWNVWDTSLLSGNLFEFDGQDFIIIIGLDEAGMIGADTTDPKQKSYLACPITRFDCDFLGQSNLEDVGASTEYNLMVRVELESINSSSEENNDSNDNDGDDSNVKEEDLLPDDWYADIPVIGSLIEQAQTKYGKYAGVSVLSVTVLGYLYRGVTMRSEYKMNKRVKKFKKLINRADSAKELRRIQADLEHAEEKRLLPRGALGDLLSLIELRAEDLGLTDFITQDALIEAGITQEDLMAGVDALNQAREDLASAQFEADKKSRRGSAPSSSQRDSPKTVATATLRGSAKGGGVKRPSYHPKDFNRDGSVGEDDERMWAEMSESEREEKRRESSRINNNIAGQVVAFSKLPPNLKSQCHCGKKKAYYKCHFKKDKCPCESGKKFYQCCAKSRGY